MKTFKGRTAVITGAASGLGLETCRLAAREGMQIVMADVQADALERAAAEIRGLAAEVLPFRLDVSQAHEVEALGAATVERFGAPHFVFNNAGVGAGGLIWEHSRARLGLGHRRQRDGRGAWRARVHAADAGRRQDRSGLRGPHRQHRVDGRAAEPAQHGRLQRQQARRGEPVARRCTRTWRWSASRSAPRCCARSSCPPASMRATATARRRLPASGPRAASASPRP